MDLPFCPAGVRITGVDLSPAMLAVARQRTADLDLSVELRDRDALALPFADAAFETVVCTLSLCAVPDERAAIGELVRLLRPGGRLLDPVGSHLRLVWAGTVERVAARKPG